jgi:hypothetical protein
MSLVTAKKCDLAARGRRIERNPSASKEEGLCFSEANDVATDDLSRQSAALDDYGHMSSSG